MLGIEKRENLKKKSRDVPRIQNLPFKPFFLLKKYLISSFALQSLVVIVNEQKRNSWQKHDLRS